MPYPTIHPSKIQIQDFRYHLPDEKIARFPLEERDQSKLLIYKNGNIQDDIYRNISDYIPRESLLIFNRAKVVHARLFFKKPSGGKIEIFCLEPEGRYADITTAMMEEGNVYWKCFLKGAAKWKGDSVLSMSTEYTDGRGEKIVIHANAEKTAQEGNVFIIHFIWSADHGQPISFSEFLDHAGKIPIPPYLKREAVPLDDVRYQTIFAEREGSVAAPTAALHFTPFILKQMAAKSIDTARLTLHVGAGTFMPVKSEKMEGHQMHSEWIEVTLSFLERIDKQLHEKQKTVTVGTTSARTLESLYWIGVQILRKEWSKEKEEGIAVSQWYPYRQPDEFAGKEAVNALIQYLKKKGMEKLITRTQLIIAPGYDFKLTDGLITNFHQPASTLLLMVSALVGDKWREIYHYALKNDFRFLSYGDGSLLWKDES